MGRILRNTAKTLIFIGLLEPITMSLKRPIYDRDFNPKTELRNTYQEQRAEGFYTPRTIVTTKLRKCKDMLAC